MNHIKTYTWGDWADDSPVDISKSSQYFMKYWQTKSWCDCIHIPGKALFDHQLLFNIGVVRSEACVIISDIDDHFTRVNCGIAVVTNSVFLDFVINKFKSPDGHFKLSVFTTKKNFDEQPWSSDCIWPLVAKHKKKVPFFLSYHPTPINLTSELYFEPKHKKNKDYFNRDVNIDLAIEDSIKQSGLRHVRVGYNQHPEVQYKLVSESIAHVSYVGGTYWLAAALKKPIIQYGHLINPNDLNTPYHTRRRKLDDSIFKVNILGGIHKKQSIEKIKAKCLDILEKIDDVPT